MVGALFYFHTLHWIELISWQPPVEAKKLSGNGIYSINIFNQDHVHHQLVINWLHNGTLLGCWKSTSGRHFPWTLKLSHLYFPLFWCVFVLLTQCTLAPSHLPGVKRKRWWLSVVKWMNLETFSLTELETLFCVLSRRTVDVFHHDGAALMI